MGDTVKFTLKEKIRQKRKKSRVMITLDFPLLCLIFPYTMKIAVHNFFKA